MYSDLVHRDWEFARLLSFLLKPEAPPGTSRLQHGPLPTAGRATISTASSTSTEVISVGSPVLEPRHDSMTPLGVTGVTGKLLGIEL